MSERPRASTKLVITLAAGMLIAGTSTSLFMKFQDNQCVANCDDPDPRKHKTFEQPILQSETMFVGEAMCLLAAIFLSSKYNPWKPPIISPGPPVHGEAPPILLDEASEADMPLKWSTRLLFAVPCTFDILGTTSMNLALLWVPVSVYQMLKGALTLWVAAFSIIFLGRRLVKAQWVSIFIVALGVAVVGYSNILSSKKAQHAIVNENGHHPVLGVFIILLAQVFIAAQFTIEEKIMEKYRLDPLVAVGWEGINGFIILGIAMPVLHMLFGRTEQGRGGYFDAPNALRELVSGFNIWGPAIIFAISVAFTNGFGLAVTKNVSATARSTIDTCRTCSIWIVSLALGWESLKFLQVVGFALLVYGTFVFNGIVAFPVWTGLHDESILADKAPSAPARNRASAATQDEAAPLLA